MIVRDEIRTLVEGLTLPECPRWHKGNLYFSDITAGRIYRLGGENRAELLYQSDGDFVGGLGFLDDDTLLAVLSKQRRIVRIADGKAQPYAALSDLCPFVLNDMVVSRNHAYISQPGFDIWADHPDGMPPATELLHVDPTRSSTLAATEMMSPNGMAISSDGRVLYVAESTALRITCYDIDPATGALSNRRLFAQLPDGGFPDGICLDDHGGVWAAVPVAVSGTSFGGGPGVIRMIEGGEVTHLVRVGSGRRALACAFGGNQRDILYVCTVPDFEVASAESDSQGKLECIEVEFKGQGVP
ncbi:putative lactone hydrolase [Caenibius tardaugens NBRC 16725]|uniref:Putative lactone hydrolase n=1 Tax=Caenibius tardaugens NBRC 16725 TaxID=1219035 RepID=U2Y471_9SPHN|nr:SMP-30/gluconolactonase/LRE family protein [Caenibius tardaugens]GAD47821.1 putative lactone hydrolase [Caenibius tardaugens NBRC 16725]